MLGVFFGGMSVLRQFSRAAEMLLRPLMDINKAMTTLGEAAAFSMMVGFGPMSVGLWDLRKLLPELISGWMNFQAVIQTFSSTLILLVSGLFNNTELMEALNRAAFALADIIDALSFFFVEFMVGLADTMVLLIENKDAILGLLETLRVVISTAISLFMPIFKFGMQLFGMADAANALTAAIAAQESPWGVLGAQIGAVLAVLVPASLSAMILLPLLSVTQTFVLALSFAVRTLEIAIIAVRLAIVALTTHPIIFALTAVAAVVVILITHFEKWGAIINAVSSALHELWDILTKVASVIPFVSLGTPVGTAVASGYAVHNIYQSVTIGNVEKTADVDEVVDELATGEKGRYR
jgi:hypothetical protein